MAQYIEFVGNHPFLFLALFIISGLLLWQFFGSQIQGAKPLSPHEVTLLINRQDALILDVREEGEFSGGHIIDALHLPLGQLDSKIDRLKGYEQHPIVAICASGQRSGQACAILKKHGFEQLHNLRGGLTAWLNAGLPLSKGKDKTAHKKPRLNKAKDETASEEEHNTSA